MELKRGGIVHQLYTAFGINEEWQATNICEVFWRIVLMLALTLGLGSLIAYGTAHLLAGWLVFAMTSVMNAPVAMSIVVTGMIAIIGAIIYAVQWLADAPPTEASKFIREAYKNHKEKHCTLVSFTGKNNAE